MSRHSIKDFDPKQVASLEMLMWRAYYAHKFFRLYRLLVQLYKEQITVGPLVASQMAYYAARAAALFRKTENLKMSERYLFKYYQLINKHSVENIDPRACAKLELHWWLVHRYPKKYKESLADAVSASTARLYSVPKARLKTYGDERATAMQLRDTATHIDNIKPDWTTIKEHLEKSYSALRGAL